MSKRVIEFFLFDIYVAILKIEKTKERFASSESLLHDFNAWDSVIREFEILGEATKHLINNNVLSDENQVIVDFRNLLIHHYFGIDSEEVWNVIEDDLPIFKNNVLSSIENIDDSLKDELIEAFIEQNKYLDFVVKSLKNKIGIINAQ